MDEFDRLSVINTTVSQAAAVISSVHHRHSAASWSSGRELVRATAREASIRARLLAEATNSTTPSLSEPS